MLYTKRFLKELAAVPISDRSRIETFVFETLPAAATPGEAGKLEKLSGFTSYYKIRFGSWRVGFRKDGDIWTAERVLDRKEIYKVFP